MKKLCALLAAAMICPMTPAAAEEEGAPTRVRVGLGAQTQPEYIGADKNQFAPLFELSIARNGEQFRYKAVDDSFGISLYSKEGFSFGPTANFQTGRKNKDVGADVGRVKSTIEVGAFAQYMMPTNTRLRLEVRQGIGGHKGMVAQLGADQVWRDGDKWDFSVGPRVIFANGKYMDSLLEVHPAHGVTSGLPVYNPGSGLRGIALASGAHFDLGGGFGVLGYGRVEKLVGDPADRPITEVKGTKHQFPAVLGNSLNFPLGE